MKRSFALAVLPLLAAGGLSAGGTAALAQMPMPAQCATFPKLTEEAAKRGAAVTEGIKTHLEPKQLCGLMNTFITAESAVVKFLVDNQTWCGIPQQAITTSKANHEKSLKFRTQVCNNDGPHAKAPSLSDAIKSTPLDTSKNTKAGMGGTFDTLTGNPLAR